MKFNLKYSCSCRGWWMTSTGAVIVPLKQTICKGHKHPLVQRGQKRWSGSNLRLQWIYILYIQTKSAWKSEGLAQLSVEYGVAHELYGQMRLWTASLVYVQVQIKVEEDELSRRPLQSNKTKNKQILSGVHDVAGERDQSQCKCSSLRSRMGLGRACWLRIEDGSSSGERNSTRPRWLKR